MESKKGGGVIAVKETIDRRIKQELTRVKSVRIEGLKLNENTLVALLLLSPEVCVNVCVTRPVMTDAVPRCFPARRA